MKFFNLFFKTQFAISINKSVFIAVFCMLSINVFSQKGVATIGFQFKPIFNNDFFRTGAQSATQGTAEVPFNLIQAIVQAWLSDVVLQNDFLLRRE